MAKSPLVERWGGDEEGTYTDLQVCRSNAGYYIGTMFTTKEGWQEPGSRDSGYYRTAEEAQAELDAMSFEQRSHP